VKKGEWSAVYQRKGGGKRKRTKSRDSAITSTQKKGHKKSYIQNSSGSCKKGDVSRNTTKGLWLWKEGADQPRGQNHSTIVRPFWGGKKKGRVRRYSQGEKTQKEDPAGPHLKKKKPREPGKIKNCEKKTKRIKEKGPCWP